MEIAHRGFIASISLVIALFLFLHCHDFLNGRPIVTSNDLGNPVLYGEVLPLAIIAAGGIFATRPIKIS